MTYYSWSTRTRHFRQTKGNNSRSCKMKIFFPCKRSKLSWLAAMVIGIYFANSCTLKKTCVNKKIIECDFQGCQSETEVLLRGKQLSGTIPTDLHTKLPELKKLWVVAEPKVNFLGLYAYSSSYWKFILNSKICFRLSSRTNTLHAKKFAPQQIKCPLHIGICPLTSSPGLLPPLEN